ncbi:hypothetical protein ACH5RR_022420 [Cinchona calisaya]|uniref:Uncharacterized protein n=1 Tax=Cinchona calisaya TaxID=153742 RepID=A0ABD2Z7R7_9GENT
MAATFCNPNIVFGASKFKEDLLYRENFTRIYPIFPLSGEIRRSWFCSFPNKKNKTCVTRLFLKHKRQHWRTFFKSSSDTDVEKVKEDDISRATLIWRAIKLPMYSVALVPLSVGSAAAYLQTGLFSAGRYIVLLASSVLIIAWLNLRSR